MTEILPNLYNAVMVGRSILKLVMACSRNLPVLVLPNVFATGNSQSYHGNIPDITDGHTAKQEQWENNHVPLSVQ